MPELIASGNPSFTVLPRENGIHYEDDTIEVVSFYGRNFMDFFSGTYFVYIGKGHAVLNGSVYMRQGTYGCFVDGDLKVTSNSEVMVVRHKKFTGIMQYGGPIEYKGRLKYIDGCSDTCLIQPIRKGDPCLNFLHFPEAIEQTPHTHPEVRVGYVARGRGRCVTPWGQFPLAEGLQFIIHPATKEKIIGEGEKKYLAGTHCFHTAESIMDIVSFHPSTSVGPTDEAHPMITQTDLVA